MNIDCGRSAGVLAFAATASRARGAALARDVMISIGSRVRFGFLLCVALAWSQSALAICYVNAAAAGSNTGASWANAYTDLQSALANWPACVDIWLARGTYKPTTTTDRSISFAIKPSVFLYGGFAGTEASLGDRNTAPMSRRSPATSASPMTQATTVITSSCWTALRRTARSRRA